MYSMLRSMHSDDASMRFSSRANERMVRQLSTLRRRMRYWPQAWTIFSMERW
jgi:hypothetical protein